MSKKFIFFFIIIILLAIGFWYWHSQSYSKEILKLEILGPEKAALGENIEYIVKFKNNGNLRAEKPELFFEYPENSILESEPKIKKLSSEDLGGDIYPGEERTFKFQTRLLGKEAEAKIAKATLIFQPKGLNQRYELSTTFTTILEKILFNFTLDFPSTIEAGENLTFRINYLSNIPYPLKDLTCQIQYPSDFEFKNSKPQALDQSQWNLPGLNEGEGGRIEVSGILRGESKEQKIFKAKIGIWEEDEFILLKEAVKGVEIVAPSLYIFQQINGNPQYIASSGNLLHYEIFFRNVGEEPLTDLVLISRLEGKGFDFYSLKALRGNFQLGDNSIIWEGKQIPKLQFLDVNEEGKIEFWIGLKTQWEMQSLADKNPEIRNKITISQAREEFSNKVTSVIKGEQQTFFEDKFFDNSGPYPLEPNKKTLFTVAWSVKNYYNDVNNVKMRAILPKEINFLGKIWPKENAGLTFDSLSREILWEAGDLPAGSGVLNEGKSCAFQLAIEPTEETAEKDILILNSAQISGDDQWTKTILNFNTSALKTEVK